MFRPAMPSAALTPAPRMQHEQFTEEQGEAEGFIDDVALLVLQAPSTRVAAVRNTLWLAALGLGLDGADAEVERVEREALAAYEKAV